MPMKDAPYETLMMGLVEQWLDLIRVKRQPRWNAHDLLVHYFSFRMKYIGYQPWKVHWSAELRAQLPRHLCRQAIGQIAVEAASGLDINCYQSKDAFNADKDDDLLNDWKIHHLHLSTEIDSEEPRFMKRSDELLFVRFDNPNAYFIDTAPHSDPGWSRRRLLEIIVDNWPTVMKPTYSRRPISPDLSDEEILHLRKAVYTCGVNIRGQGYVLPGYGYTSSGDNMVAIGKSHEVWRWAHANREVYEHQRPIFIAKLREQLHM